MDAKAVHKTGKSTRKADPCRHLPQCAAKKSGAKSLLVSQNLATVQVAGEPRGRADTPGFDRWPDRGGQQVTEFGVPPLPRKQTQQEARIFGEGFLFFLAGLIARHDRPRSHLARYREPWRIY